MSAGAFVFPITVGLFVAFLTGYLFSTPAQPNLVVDYGDQLTIEVIQYYGTGGVWWTSREDLDFSGAPYPPILDSRPRVFPMPEAHDPMDPVITELVGKLVGKREGQTFDTAKIPSPYSGWTDTDRILAPALNLTFPQDVSIPGQFEGRYPRNFTMFAEDANKQGKSLRVDEVFLCEGQAWPCRITEVDAEKQTLVFRREAAVGQTFPIRELHSLDLLGAFFHPLYPPPDATGVVQEVTEQGINVTIRFRPGDAFTLISAVSGWEAGGYRIIEPRPDGFYWTHHIKFADNLQSPPPYVLGEPLWFRITVVKIDKKEATTPTPP